MLEILMDNKNGNMWDVSEIASGLTWSTTRIGRPASIDLTLLHNGMYQAKEFDINNGDIIRVKYDGVNVFYGYIFSVKSNQDDIVTIKAYDQIRYLLVKDTYIFKETTASSIIKKIAEDFKLKIGRIDDTGYLIPSMVEDGQTLLDIIDKALTHTLINSQKNYVFFDDFGALSLRLVNDFVSGFYIGDKSLLTGYDYERDIESDTFNQIKLYRDNKKTGKRDIYQTQDSANIARWGLLQLYESVDENMNDAQINEKLTQLAELKNKETKSLKLEAIGDIRIRAGTYLHVIIGSLGIKQPMLVEDVKHRFNGADHKMTLTLKVI
ncbi:hypothetical protein [Paenibacillus sp. L3-i20]|uniref:XkdQ/YqbQ family protein n=1 Tax=Paenibacillus sp. L3-i20 TaxID=2905833 RepID=UPI001EDEB092|nr:hypothetical protein [Paenibacillus sp. L3-i20]GKU75654.1 hypothetical protein L3i20_v200510 [Paenibacillus sp. L3-i20]